ncbi:myo-inositol-1(or 4)-monophosphatase [Allocatelliglobosispora scoriae]|uniref:Myo-inositol-1(Or 4)-monophosphatase n=2 Tax=Allocatelliglobosispora scoriae TaxID=643052 RepID=A0A841BTV3_9ACTN|nr:myo-inositol-1(or 4)-monophosphatase [Allocatelliglobosispora scoriae]
MASEADYAIERAVRAFLAIETPSIAFIGEEDGTTGPDGDWAWILDPIDGTVNYLHGSPLCAVSLALVHRNRPVLGIIDAPRLRTRFTAVEGGGAWENGNRIHTSTVDRLDEAVVAIGDYAVGTDAQRKNDIRIKLTASLAATVQRIRMHGTAAIDFAFLAAGKIDATVTMSNNPWDMSAGVIIAREAGALVVDADGSEHTTESSATIGCAPGISELILAMIAQARQ